MRFTKIAACVHDLESKRLLRSFTDNPTISQQQDLIRPLTYRHVTFDGHTKHATDRFFYFAKRLDPDDETFSAKASWIHTFWLQRDVFEEYESLDYPRKFGEAFTKLLPRLTSLQEISLRMIISVQNFEIIARCQFRSLAKMVVTFQSRDLARVLPLFKHFTALQDLNLVIHYGGPTFIPEERNYLQNLRSIELDAGEASTCLLRWLNWATFPKLKRLSIHANDSLDLAVLSTFISRHSAHLTTFGWNGYIPGITTAVFPFVPRLLRLEFCPPFTILELLQGLPISVTEVVFSRFGHQLGYSVNFIDQMALVVEQLSQGSALRSFRVVEHSQFLGPLPYSWRTEVRRTEKRRIDVWKRFKESAARMLAHGVIVVDEEGISLTDALKEVGEL